MYNQTKLELHGSRRLSLIIAIPFIAAIYLVFHIEIDFVFLATLVFVLAISGIHLVRKICLLNYSGSVKYIDVSERKITSTNIAGIQSEHKLRHAIVSHSFCLISIDFVDPINNKLFSSLLRTPQCILITKLNTEDVNNFRRLKALLTLCANKL